MASWYIFSSVCFSVLVCFHNFYCTSCIAGFIIVCGTSFCLETFDCTFQKSMMFLKQCHVYMDRHCSINVTINDITIYVKYIEFITIS